MFKIVKKHFRQFYHVWFLCSKNVHDYSIPVTELLPEIKSCQYCDMINIFEEKDDIEEVVKKVNTMVEKL